MQHFLQQTFIFLQNNVDVGIVFISAFILIILAFVINFLVFRKKNSMEKGRKIYFLFCSGVLSLQGFFSVVLEQGKALLLFNFSTFIFLLIAFLTNKKEEKIEVFSEHKALIDYAEESVKLKKEKAKAEEKKVLFDFEKLLTKREGVKKIPVKSQPKEEKVEELNYSNVKKAIEKSLSKSLSEKEKNQVLSLEFALLQKERGEENMFVNEQVNEGLSALLKIMSKHCV